MTAGTDAFSMPSSRRRHLAETIAAAVDEVPGVRRTQGSGVVVATLYAGGQVTGVALSEESVLICVALSRLPVSTVADEIIHAAGGALTTLGDDRRVRVQVDDLDVDRLPKPSVMAPAKRGRSTRH